MLITINSLGSCSVNAGETIEVDLGDVFAANFRVVGHKPLGHVVAEAADDLDDLGQLAGFVVQCEQQREAVARGGLFAAEDDEAGGVVAVGVDAGDGTSPPAAAAAQS